MCPRRDRLSEALECPHREAHSRQELRKPRNGGNRVKGLEGSVTQWVKYSPHVMRTEFRSQHLLHKKLGPAAHFYNPRAGGAETGGFLELNKPPGSVRDPVTKTKE